MDEAETDTTMYSDTDSDTGSDADSDTDRGSDASDWTPPRPTGVPAVDAAIAKLGELEGKPASEHVAVYDGVHRLLQDALVDLDGS